MMPIYCAGIDVLLVVLYERLIELVAVVDMIYVGFQILIFAGVSSKNHTFFFLDSDLNPFGNLPTSLYLLYIIVYTPLSI